MTFWELAATGGGHGEDKRDSDREIAAEKCLTSVKDERPPVQVAR